MMDRDAQEIIRMIESNWHFDLGTARGIWREELMKHEVDPVIQAVAGIATNKPGRIELYDLTQALRIQRERERSRLQEEERQKEIREQGKRGHASPEWVWVWSWARHDRDPREGRDFPQMGTWSDPENTMTQAEYETLRDEWIAAGSPKAKNPLPTATVR